MKLTRAQLILREFFKNAAYEIDPNAPLYGPMPSKAPSGKVPLSKHWHPEEEPRGCNSQRGGKSCELSGPHSDHKSGNRMWTD